MTNPLQSLFGCACLSSRPKYPDPYAFSFEGSK